MTATQVKCSWGGCKNEATCILHHKWAIRKNGKQHQGKLPCCNKHTPTWAKDMKNGEETQWYRVEVM